MQTFANPHGAGWKESTLRKTHPQRIAGRLVGEHAGSFRVGRVLRLSREQLEKLAAEIGPKARSEYLDSRDHYVRTRQPISLELLALVWATSSGALAKLKARHKAAGRCWDAARDRYWQGVAEEAHRAAVTQVAEDERARQALYKQHLSTCFAQAQRLLMKLNTDLPKVNLLTESIAVLNLQRLLHVGRAAWDMDQSIFGHPVLKEADARHVADLTAIREAISREVTDPDALGRLRRAVDAAIVERERESAEGFLRRMGALTDDAELLGRLEGVRAQLAEIEEQARRSRAPKPRQDAQEAAGDVIEAVMEPGPPGAAEGPESGGGEP